SCSRREKTLVIDLDAQANLSTALLGSKRYQEQVSNRCNGTGQYTSFQIFLDAINDTKLFDPDDYIIKSAVRYKDKYPLPKLDLLPTSVSMMRLEREIVNYERTKYQILWQTVDTLKANYDYILLDCPPNIYTATHNALYASDYYVIPTIPDFLSITGITLLTRSLKKTSKIKFDEKNQESKLAGIIINMLDRRLAIHNDTVREIGDMLQWLKEEQIVSDSAKVFGTHIRNLVEIKKALDSFAPICIYNPRSESTAEFRECTHEIVEHISE
ncbi:MAG: ParA family protein, partial [Candidatus Hermodarchaeota archaeon]